MGFENFNQWDVLLILVVTLMGTGLSYLHHPRIKAMIITLPFPFTLAALAVGKPMNSHNIMGVILLFLFTHGVRILHCRFRVPIVASITASALLYTAAGGILVDLLPLNDLFFWSLCAMVLVFSIYLYLTQPVSNEPGHKTPLPAYIKVPLIMGVVLFVVWTKSWIQGFITVFPMVGVIGVYEARKSLWTMCRQIPILMMTFTAMVMTVKIFEPLIGLGWGIGVGWISFLAVFVPISIRQWRQAL